MSVETRHTEKSILFRLLRCKTLEEYKEAIMSLKATMEPEDVELVEKRVAELESGSGK